MWTAGLEERPSGLQGTVVRRRPPSGTCRTSPRATARRWRRRRRRSWTQGWQRYGANTRRRNVQNLDRNFYSALSQQMPSQTFGNFVPDTETGEAYRLALEFAENPTEYHIFTIRGGVGTGKTHLLQAIGWASLDAGRQPKFISVASWLDKLRGTFDDDSLVSFIALYRPLEAAQMLLLDDIGAERMTNWGQEQLYKIVNHRYQEGLPMAVSMNLDAAKAVDIYGERTTDRLLDTGSGRVRVVNTGSKSYRTGR